MSASVEMLTRRLSDDPYRLDLLIERLLAHIEHRDLSAARGDLATLQRLGAMRALGPSFARAIEGQMRVVSDGDLYLLFDAALESTLLGWTLHFLRSARLAADRFFGPLRRCVVAEVSGQLYGFHHALSEIPGVGYIRLSPRTSLVEHEAVIAHELAHVYLTSGNRFIDEGIATFFQADQNDGRIFIGTEFETHALLEQKKSDILPLRALLAHDARNDVFFDRLSPSPERKRLVYVAAHAFIAHVMSHFGIGGLRALCATLRVCPVPAAHPAVVAKSLDIGIERLDRLLFRGPSPVRTGPALAQDGAVLSATVIWSPMEAHELEGLIQRSREALAEDSTFIDAQATLVRALIRRMLHQNGQECAADFAEARSFMYGLSTDFRFPDRDRLLLEAWLAIAQTHSASSTASRIVSWEKALETFRLAMERFPDDPEVLCGSAILHLRGPEEYGANRVLARACLQKVCRLNDWASIVHAIEKAHGLAAAE